MRPRLGRNEKRETGDGACREGNAAQLKAAGERIARIIEYLDPASTHQNAVAVVSGVPPEQKGRALKLLAGEK